MERKWLDQEVIELGECIRFNDKNIQYRQNRTCANYRHKNNHFNK